MPPAVPVDVVAAGAVTVLFADPAGIPLPVPAAVVFVGIVVVLSVVSAVVVTPAVVLAAR